MRGISPEYKLKIKGMIDAPIKKKVCNICGEAMSAKSFFSACHSCLNRIEKNLVNAKRK